MNCCVTHTLHAHCLEKVGTGGPLVCVHYETAKKKLEFAFYLTPSKGTFLQPCNPNFVVSNAFYLIAK